MFGRWIEIFLFKPKIQLSNFLKLLDTMYKLVQSHLYENPTFTKDKMLQNEVCLASEGDGCMSVCLITIFMNYI